MISLRSFGYSVHNLDNTDVLKRAVDECGYDAVFERLNYVISLQGNENVIKNMKKDLQVLTMLNKSNKSLNNSIIVLKIYKREIKLSIFGYSPILSNKERYDSLKRAIKIAGKVNIINRLLKVSSLTKNDVKKNIFENDIRWLKRGGFLRRLVRFIFRV